MVKRWAENDDIEVIECVGTLTEAAGIFKVKRSWVKYLCDFSKISSRKSGNTILVDLHSLAQYVDLYRKS